MIAKRRHRVRYSSKDERWAIPIMIRNKVEFLILKNFFFVTMSLLIWVSSQKTLTVVSFSGFLTTSRMNSAIKDSISFSLIIVVWFNILMLLINRGCPQIANEDTKNKINPCSVYDAFGQFATKHLISRYNN